MKSFSATVFALLLLSASAFRFPGLSSKIQATKRVIRKSQPQDYTSHLPLKEIHAIADQGSCIQNEVSKSVSLTWKNVMNTLSNCFSSVVNVVSDFLHGKRSSGSNDTIDATSAVQNTAFRNSQSVVEDTGFRNAETPVRIDKKSEPTMSQKKYVAAKLRIQDAVACKAAGVLLYRQNRITGRVEYLLGEKIENPSWTILGGKVDQSDEDVLCAALREFNEETSMLLDPDSLASIKRYLMSSARVMWYAPSKYALFLLPVEFVPGLYETTDDLPSRMNQFVSDFNRWVALPTHCREMRALKWVAADRVLSEKLYRFARILFGSATFKSWSRQNQYKHVELS